MGRSIAVATAAALCVSAAFAQDTLDGSYKGSVPFQTGRGPFDIGVTLVIAKVQDGAISGVGSLHTGACRGDYPLEGKGSGNGFYVLSAKGGPSGDCTFGFKGRLEGNKLVGTMGKYDVELRK